MDYKAIIRDIENKKFEKIYFLHGEEPFFIDEITKALFDNVLEEHERDFNQAVMYGKDSEVLNVISEAKGYPMMSEYKLVVIKEAQDLKNFDLLESYFEQPADNTVFVINYKYKTYDTRKKIAKTAAKNGIIFKSEKIREYNLAEWINAYVRTKEYSITSKGSIMLSEFLGNDLSRITNELNKLFLLIEKGTTINEVHIEENIGISKDYNPYELTNAILVRDVPKAFSIVHYFEHNPKAGELIVIIPTIFNVFTKLMRIHFLPNNSKEAIAQAIGVHPFVATSYINAAKVYNPKKIAANIAILHEYDLKSKGVDNATFTGGELMREMIYRLLH